MGVYQKGTGVTITELFELLGVPTDPTTVTFYIQDPLGNVQTYVWLTDPEVTKPVVGTFVLDLMPPLIPGDYGYEAIGTGTVEASNFGNFTILDDPIAPTATLVSGPCAPWVTADDVATCCADADADADFSVAAYQASAILYEFSGRQFAGLCSRTVRPCSSRCACPPVGRWGWAGGSWECEGRPCGCASVARVRLAGYPVRAIEEVKIDGLVLTADEYRLDERRYLTRMRDPGAPTLRQLWPGCQRLDLDDTEDGTFSVTYWYGRDAPVAGQRAAAELACQFFLACGGGDASACQLPSGVVRVQRQGISFDLNAFRSWGMETNARGTATGSWHTGLPLVDAFLSAANPQGLRRRPAIWSPDVEPYARPVG